MSKLTLTFVIIGALVPFITSTLCLFSPTTRSENVKDYFLFGNSLSVDNFLKSSIGYSLQVASITLLFYWTTSVGILGPVLVCLAWAVGFWLLASAVERGYLDHFLTAEAATIHGFVAHAVHSTGSTRHIVVIALATASVIGLGGTMVAETDYAVQLFSRSVGGAFSSGQTRVVLQCLIVALIAVYVWWGGFRASVVTDRLQVPMAYVAFALFTFGSVFFFSTAGSASVAVPVICVMVLCFSLLMYSRYSLLRAEAPQAVWDRRTAVLTFVPVIVAGVATVAYLLTVQSQPSVAAAWPILFPANTDFIGLGGWGALALLVTNGIWQLIDASSLQRLQSIRLNGATEVAERDKLAHILRRTGAEASAGWFLIVMTAVLLRCNGWTSDNFVEQLVKSAHGAVLLPVFIFTVSVYMHSTVACFISALSYIAFFDLVPVVAPWEGKPASRQLANARLTTIGALIILCGAYFALRVEVPDEAVAGVLYGIYAFQITILPTVLIALLLPRSALLHPLPIISSVIAGIVVALLAAIAPDGWKLFACIGMGATSWTVIPPLASAFASCLAYAAALFLVKRRPGEANG